MTTMTWCKLASLAVLATALSLPIQPAGAISGAAGLTRAPDFPDIILAQNQQQQEPQLGQQGQRGQQRTQKKNARRGNSLQQGMQKAKKYLPPEYHQYLDGAGGLGGMRP